MYLQKKSADIMSFRNSLITISNSQITVIGFSVLFIKISPFEESIHRVAMVIEFSDLHNYQNILPKSMKAQFYSQSGNAYWVFSLAHQNITFKKKQSILRVAMVIEFSVLVIKISFSRKEKTTIYSQREYVDYNL